MAPFVQVRQLYLANMMSTIKAKALQLEADLAAGGTPNAFPSVPVTCNLEWDLLQQMHPYNLVCTVSLTGRKHMWRNAVRQCAPVFELEVIQADEPPASR